METLIEVDSRIFNSAYTHLLDNDKPYQVLVGGADDEIKATTLDRVNLALTWSTRRQSIGCGKTSRIGSDRITRPRLQQK